MMLCKQTNQKTGYLPGLAALVLLAVCASCTTSKTDFARNGSSRQDVPEYMLLESRYAADVLYTPLAPQQIADTVKQLLASCRYAVKESSKTEGTTSLEFTGPNAKGTFTLQSIHSIPQKYNYIYRIKILKFPSTVPQDRAINNLANQLRELINSLSSSTSGNTPD